MTLYLVRHGRAADGVDALDPGLDELGWQQAHRTADALRGVPTTRLIVSPLRRARETAEPIAAVLGLEPHLEPGVAEVFPPELSAEERVAMIGPLLGGRWSEQPDTLRAARQRVLEALEGLAGSHAVVVSHFVAISAAIGAATGDDRVSPVPLANASITVLDATEGGLDLRRAGDTSHLTEEQRTATRTALAGTRG